MSVDATRADPRSAPDDPAPPDSEPSDAEPLDAESADADLRDGGETLAVPERVVVAPGVGRFRPTIDTARARHLRRGDAIGVVEGPRHEVVVRSPFAGEVMGLLARDGERVQSGEPLLWLRVS